MHAEIVERATRRLLLRAPMGDPRIGQMQRQGGVVWWVQDPEDRKPGTLNWRYRSTVDSEIALFEGCGFRVIVHDMDGDASSWSVQGRYGDRRFHILAEGEESGFEPYHMDAAMVAAEKAFRAQVERRKQIIRCVRQGLPVTPAGLDAYR